MVWRALYPPEGRAPNAGKTALDQKCVIQISGLLQEKRGFALVWFLISDSFSDSLPCFQSMFPYLLTPLCFIWRNLLRKMYRIHMHCVLSSSCTCSPACSTHSRQHSSFQSPQSLLQAFIYCIVTESTIKKQEETKQKGHAET